MDESDINENRNDQPTEQDVVWRLPPSYQTSQDDPALRAEMDAIGVDIHVLTVNTGFFRYDLDADLALQGTAQALALPVVPAVAQLVEAREPPRELLREVQDRDELLTGEVAGLGDLFRRLCQPPHRCQRRAGR